MFLEHSNGVYITRWDHYSYQRNGKWGEKRFNKRKVWILRVVFLTCLKDWESRKLF